MTDETVAEAPELVGVGVQTVVEDANRLGLTWQLKLATVTDNSPAQAIYDGDTAAIGMVSMIGSLEVGARVYVLVVPPSGNFVVGQVVNQQSGTEIITFASATFFTQTVTFPTPFLTTPKVFTNIASGSGLTSRWDTRAISITTNDFTLFGFSNDPAASAWSDIPVNWLAVT
jgi:hypothetical protein